MVFEAMTVGSSALSIEGLQVTGASGAPTGSCSPPYLVVISCAGGTMNVVGPGLAPVAARERFTMASATGLRRTVAMPKTASRMFEIAPLVSSVATPISNEDTDFLRAAL